MNIEKRLSLVTKLGTLKRLHVDRKVMAQNKKASKQMPALTIQTSAGPLKAMKVKIHGPSMLVQSGKPLSCGARAWLETRAVVERLA